MDYSVENVRPKKHLGQHFLKDHGLAAKIAGSLSGHGDYSQIIEVGPGTGVLTQFLLQKDNPFKWWGVEVDTESINYLRKAFPDAAERIVEEDFLTTDLKTFSNGAPMAVIGNFPYNISSQILFRILEFKNLVPEVVGMFQKEVAQRIVAGPGGKVSGILSVLCQAFYNIEYLFEVPPSSFNPPPKVTSAVIRFKRNEVESLPCDEKKFFRIVKTAFNQRRKTLRNSLKIAAVDWESASISELAGKRAEELSVDQFVLITQAARS